MKIIKITCYWKSNHEFHVKDDFDEDDEEAWQAIDELCGYEVDTHSIAEWYRDWDYDIQQGPPDNVFLDPNQQTLDLPDELLHTPIATWVDEFKARQTCFHCKELWPCPTAKAVHTTNI